MNDVPAHVRGGFVDRVRAVEDRYRSTSTRLRQ
ncbi:hypothetical protein FHS07_001543 [Microbacterium proteolyticum]|uniref:Uncharacterized protein n=1 Tax=Microbacterium proteolyticum TaxID=1572644 RepID=A0A7W5CIF5_9MICO|nr:hypothetical protein [Microbacterium proteolyticum]